MNIECVCPAEPGAPLTKTCWHSQRIFLGVVWNCAVSYRAQKKNNANIYHNTPSAGNSWKVLTYKGVVSRNVKTPDGDLFPCSVSLKGQTLNTCTGMKYSYSRGQAYLFSVVLQWAAVLSPEVYILSSPTSCWFVVNKVPALCYEFYFNPLWTCPFAFLTQLLNLLVFVL